MRLAPVAGPNHAVEFLNGPEVSDAAGANVGPLTCHFQRADRFHSRRDGGALQKNFKTGLCPVAELHVVLDQPTSDLNPLAQVARTSGKVTTCNKQALSILTPSPEALQNLGSMQGLAESPASQETTPQRL